MSARTVRAVLLTAAIILSAEGVTLLVLRSWFYGVLAFAAGISLLLVRRMARETERKT